MKPTPKGLKALNWITVLLFIAATYLVLFYAPREGTMGEVQRVFYFHVAAGWTGALGFLVFLSTLSPVRFGLDPFGTPGGRGIPA